SSDCLTINSIPSEILILLNSSTSICSEISSPCFLKQSGPSSELQLRIRKDKIIQPNCFNLNSSFDRLRMTFTKKVFSNCLIFKFVNHSLTPTENSKASALEKCVFNPVPAKMFL